MALPISNNTSPYNYARDILGRVKAAHNAVLKSQSDLTTDNYGTLINLPSTNKAIQDLITEIQASGQVPRIMAQINEQLPSDITTADLIAFTDALDTLAGDIEANAALFLVSINSTSKNTQFTTAVSAGVKSAITTRINAVLAEIS